MATLTVAQSASRPARRPLDVHAIVSELLRYEDETDDVGLEESGFCRLIEMQGMIGRDLELGMFE